MCHRAGFGRESEELFGGTNLEQGRCSRSEKDHLGNRGSDGVYVQTIAIPPRYNLFYLAGHVYRGRFSLLKNPDYVHLEKCV